MDTGIRFKRAARLDAGQLRSRGTLQGPPTALDDLNQPVGPWIDLGPLWGDIRHLSGLQTIKAGADASVVHASIRIRFRADIVAGMRAVFGSTTYRIRAVLPDARRVYADLVAEVIE